MHLVAVLPPVELWVSAAEPSSVWFLIMLSVHGEFWQSPKLEA